MSQSRIYKVEAIILKRKNVGEADRILTVFSRQYGKLKVIAKGIRRITSRRAPSLEVFNRVLLMLHKGRTLDIVSEVELLDAHPAIRKDLELVNTGYYACELVDALLPERQEHRDVYELLKNYLRTLGSTDEFALALLERLGFLPPGHQLATGEIGAFVERIAERPIRTYRFLKPS